MQRINIATKIQGLVKAFAALCVALGAITATGTLASAQTDTARIAGTV